MCHYNKYTIIQHWQICFLETALVLDPRSKCEPQENNSRDLVDESPSLEEQREKRVGVKQGMAEKGSLEERKEKSEPPPAEHAASVDRCPTSDYSLLHISSFL